MVMTSSVEKYMVGKIEVEVTDDGVRVGGVFLPHNEHPWRRATNRHTTEYGKPWGWIAYGNGVEVAGGHWSNDWGDNFTGEMANIAVSAHNKWLDSIQAVQIKLIKARRKLNQAEKDLSLKETEYNKAKVEYENAQAELQNILDKEMLEEYLEDMRDASNIG